MSINGNQVFDGMNLFFNKIKKEDTQSTFAINLSTLDDEADIPKIRQNTKTLLKKSPLFISTFDANSMFARKKFITNQKIAGFFPLDGANTFRIPTATNVVYFRPPHAAELAALIDYSVAVLNKKKIAIFYEASDWGEECCALIKKILKTTYDLQPVATNSYQQKTVNIAAAVSTIAAAAPNAIICIAQARPAYNFICQLFNKGLHETTFFGLEQLYNIKTTLKETRGIEIITSSVVPDPVKSNLAIAKAYRTDMKKDLPNKQLTPLSFEGYINAAIFYTALSSTQPPVTAQKIINVITNFNKFNFNGLNLTFNQKTRALSACVWVNNKPYEVR